MDQQDESTIPSTDMNGLVAVLLADVAGRPVPLGAETRLAEIHQAVSVGSATDDMVIEIMRLFPNC